MLFYVHKQGSKDPDDYCVAELLESNDPNNDGKEKSSSQQHKKVMIQVTGENLGMEEGRDESASFLRKIRGTQPKHNPKTRFVMWNDGGEKAGTLVKKRLHEFLVLGPKWVQPYVVQELKKTTSTLPTDVKFTFDDASKDKIDAEVKLISPDTISTATAWWNIAPQAAQLGVAVEKIDEEGSEVEEAQEVSFNEENNSNASALRSIDRDPLFFADLELETVLDRENPEFTISTYKIVDRPFYEVQNAWVTVKNEVNKKAPM